jgi:hypothetical protein
MMWYPKLGEFYTFELTVIQLGEECYMNGLVENFFASDANLNSCSSREVWKVLPLPPPMMETA